MRPAAIYGPADESFLAEMIELAGGDPITTGARPTFEISLERLIEADPEVIVLGERRLRRHAGGRWRRAPAGTR